MPVHLAKSDRALIFGLWVLAVAIYPQWMQWNNLLWSIASILLLWTAINRCRSVLLMNAEKIMLEKSLATLFALLILAMLINRFLVWRLPERKGG